MKGERGSDNESDIHGTNITIFQATQHKLITGEATNTHKHTLRQT